MNNEVILLDYLGSDELHAFNAWASTFAEFDVDMPEDIKKRLEALISAIHNNGKKKKSIPELINFLAEHGHASPFRSSHFVFLMTEDIATHIHLLKHKVLVKHENAESARYKELKEDKFYLPMDWLNYGKTGAYWFEKLKETSAYTNSLYHAALGELLNAGMPRNRAKESARFFKMYNSQLNVVRSISFDGIRQLHEKRGANSGSQVEVSGIVNQMVLQVQNIPGNPFEHSLKAWGLNK